MRPFVENFPFFSIFLAILAAIVTAAIRSGRISYWITIGVCAASALLNGWVLEYTYAEGVSFTYAWGDSWRRTATPSTAGRFRHCWPPCSPW